MRHGFVKVAAATPDIRGEKVELINKKRIFAEGLKKQKRRTQKYWCSRNCV